MNRRAFVGSLGAAAAMRLDAQTQSRPNFIFILADDLGWGDLGCYGQREARTPHLDRMAREGTLFTQGYVNNPVCSPSRTSWLTGHFPARHAVHGHFATEKLNAERGMPNFLDPRAITLPRLLRNAGYKTAHIGKWHLGSGDGAPEPDAYGFDEVRALNSNTPEYRETGDFRAQSSRIFVDDAIRFIQQNRQQPFYVNLWMLLPHATLDPTDEQMKPWSRLGPGGEDFRHKGAKQIYFASLSDLDEQVGRLLAKLDELGLSENTVVVFSSDNGPEDIHINNASHSAIGSPGPFRGRKRSLYEGGVRVPFIVRWKGHTPAERVDDTSVVSGADWLPTACKLAGVSFKDDFGQDGEDRSAVFLGQASERRKPLMWEWRFNIFGYGVNRSPMLAIREGRWKLLMNPDRSRVELYDIPADSEEMTNLAPKHPEVVRRLSEKVLAWQKTLPAGPVLPQAGKDNWPMPRAQAGRL